MSHSKICIPAARATPPNTAPTNTLLILFILLSSLLPRWLQQEIENPQEYELTITDPDGVVLERQYIDGYLESDGRHPATSLRLVIDRLGPVYVEKRSEGIGLPWTRMEAVVDNPPWQREEQKEMLEALRERERQREETRRQDTQGNLDRPAYLEIN